MRKKLAIVILLFSFMLPVEAAKTKVSELPPRHKKWLEEEVMYIILPRESEVFLELKTDRERDLFIEAFWKQRDPTPGTPENEAKQEHYSRINHANRYFGRGTPKAGWKTDRGRIYIILGEPNDIQRFEGKTMTYPAEVWFYQGKTNLGLPPGFNLVFYQESFTGEYRLYSPLKDGPQALMTSYWGDPADYFEAYKKLMELEPNLADVSLSLIPGEESAAFGRPSLASDLLIQKVETVPRRQIEDRYAQKFLQYKDIVEVEYTANYIDSDTSVKVIKEPSGVYFVHYAIQPDRLSVNFYENKYYTNLKLNGTITNLEGKIIYQYEKTISLEFDQERMKSLSRIPFNIHDMFPIIPGSYKFSVLVKNEVSKEFTSLERDILIPQEETPLQMVSMILGYKVKRIQSEGITSKLKPFCLGQYQVYFQPNRVFLKQDPLVVAFQIHGINEYLREKGEVRFTFYKSGEAFRSISKKVTEFPDLPNIVEEFSLQDFPPAHYRVQVSLMAEGREVLFESDEFDITYLAAIARPWIYSKILPDSNDPVYYHVIGTQLFNSGKIGEARTNMEKAFQKKPDSEDFALNLARLYMVLAEYEKVEPLLLPFLSKPQPKYEIYFMMGKAYQNMGKLDKAIDIFDKILTAYGLNIHVLNALGECYFQLGNAEEALLAWEKSLEIDANQPQIKKNVEALKEKK
ncbi:MAG: GWxTD domain-containing protein [Candidatus Aminicenantaceae bacterium]